ncbi:MAG TPA: oligosaccharide flippase family protein, partial [Bacteroidota bacterium]|nr:oligosaccharide flippase family protein [Bacteroidota bacterium]
MDTTRRLVRNTLYLGFANLCSPLISMVLIIFVSRHLGADGLGAYSAALAFVFFFEKFAQLGIHQLVLRDIANDISRCKPYLIACTLIGLISSL